MPEISLRSDFGTYILVLANNRKETIQIGKSGQLKLESGYYFYVGSAFGPGGIKARVGRHLKSDKKCRWHIDYLREFTTVHAVLINYDTCRCEQRWVEVLNSYQKLIIPKDGFGASDSRNQSHLFFSAEMPDLKSIQLMLGIDVTVSHFV